MVVLAYDRETALLCDARASRGNAQKQEIEFPSEYEYVVPSEISYFGFAGQNELVIFVEKTCMKMLFLKETGSFNRRGCENLILLLD